MWARVPTFVLALLLVACGAARAGDDASSEGGPRRASQAFVSAEALLVELELDGHVQAPVGSSPPDLRALAIAQLMYSVGQLNADRSVGHFERLELTALHAEPKDAATIEVGYHARLPVAWGGGAIPSQYLLVLPLRAGTADAAAFASKYGATCVLPSEGAADAWRMFLVYRPLQPGCTLDPSDVVALPAKVSPLPSTKAATYPEYDAIWRDGILDVVAMFTLDHEPGDSDDGLHAFRDFQARVEALLAWVQPDAEKRSVESSAAGAEIGTDSSTSLDDGRSIRIHARLVRSPIADEGAVFDTWFDRVTPSADLVLFNGHAGLGENVRTLAKKGTYRTGQYVLWAINGCDTFAYLDRTLADRRAALNPDDPLGTKYMDRVTNAMPGYFGSAPTFAMRFVEAALAAGGRDPAPKTYQEILATLDPAQVTVVTGDEDNAYAPPARAPKPTGSAVTTLPGTPADVGGGAAENGPPALYGATAPTRAACSAATGPSPDSFAPIAIAIGALLALSGRRRPARLRADSATSAATRRTGRAATRR